MISAYEVNRWAHMLSETKPLALTDALLQLELDQIDSQKSLNIRTCRHDEY